jgi:hypothetical protein
LRLPTTAACARLGAALIAAAAMLAVVGLCSAERATAVETTWLGEVNKYRTASGVPAVSEQPAWEPGIQAHLRYLALTPASLMSGAYASAHSENPQSQYYTPDGAAAGQSSNLDYGGTDVGAIDYWLTAPFHAIGILRPSLRQVAFARDAGTGRAGLDVIRGLASFAPPAAPVLFPGPGMTTGLSAFGGGESPSPLETCGWKDDGPRSSGCRSSRFFRRARARSCRRSSTGLPGARRAPAGRSAS